MLSIMAAEIIVTLTGVREPTGDIYLQLCRRDTFLTGSCEHQVKLAPEDGVHVFEGVEPGRWAATAWHDPEGDGVMRTHIFGIPAEPTAISNNPPARFGPPRFNDAAFAYADETVRITLEF